MAERCQDMQVAVGWTGTGVLPLHMHHPARNLVAASPRWQGSCLRASWPLQGS